MKYFVITLLLLPVISVAQIDITNYTITVPDQKQHSNGVYKPNIQTAMLYNRSKQNSMPVITLNTIDQLLLCFDDLNGGIKNYYFSAELCDASWNPTNLPALIYLADFTQSRINNYHYSFNTKQKYTYYEAVFPNSEIKPTKGGNYLLKVFEDGDESKLILTRRFYVLDKQAGISLIKIPATFNDFEQKQQVNFVADIGALNVTDPFSQVKAVIVQNARADNMQQPQAPPFLDNNRLNYNGLNDDIFMGGNEFRYVDLSSLRFMLLNVKKLNSDSINRVNIGNRQANGQPPLFTTA